MIDTCAESDRPRWTGLCHNCLVLLDLDTGCLENRIVLAVPVQITKNNYGSDQDADHDRFQGGPPVWFCVLSTLDKLSLQRSHAAARTKSVPKFVSEGNRDNSNPIFGHYGAGERAF